MAAPGHTVVRSSDRSTGIADDEFIRMRDVLEFHREHFPGRPGDFVSYSPSRRSRDDCRVVLPEEIRQFTLTGPERWADFKEIVQRFSEQRRAGAAANLAPYRYDAVFSAVKLVLRESDRPIRAAIVEEPVYPTRGRLAVARSPWAVAHGYVSLAVLNSALGLAFYHRSYPGRLGREASSRDGLSMPVLGEIPVLHRHCTAEDLDRAAESSYRVRMLALAEQDCSEDFSQEIRSLRLVLLSHLARVLRLQEGVPDELIAYARRWRPTDAPAAQLTLAESLHDLAPVEQVRLLDTSGRARLELLEARARRAALSASEVAELTRLSRRRTWEQRINGDVGKGTAVWSPTTWRDAEASPGPPAPGAADRGGAGDRSTGTLPPSEAALLKEINQGFPAEFWQRYRELQEKLRAETLTAVEHEELIGCSDQLEAANVRRIERLIELARLRGTTLPTLMAQLGLSPPAHD